MADRRGGEERAIAGRVNALWCELTGSRRANDHVSLRDQGGDSLLLVALLGEIDDEFGVDVGVEDLLRDPTIAGLARVIASSGDDPR